MPNPVPLPPLRRLATWPARAGILVLAHLGTLHGEPTQLYSHGDPSDAEQYALEIVNGPTTTTLGLLDPPPLAFHPQLLAAARVQAAAMVSGNYLGHRPQAGTPAESAAAIVSRLNAAGYGAIKSARELIYGPLSSSLSSGIGKYGALDLPAFPAWQSISADVATTAPKEAGIGLASGTGSAVAPVVMVQELATSAAEASTPFLTGVAFRDRDLDAAYSMGEGLAGITVKPTSGDYYAVTSASGGYALPLRNLPAGATSVTVNFSGGSLGTTTVTKTIALRGTENVRADYVSPVVRLINLSTRLRVETGDQVAIAGFVVGGSGSKRVLVRALGPSLTAAGVTGALADPTLQLADAQGATLASNDQWAETQAAGINATGLAPGSATESAILTTLAPGSYTAIVRGAGATTGIGLVEVYDLDLPADSYPINVSTRGVVGTGDAVMIAGFVVKGADSKTVVVRAIGPSLTAAGVSGALSDPSLELYNAAGTLVQQNDNWADTQSAALTAAGLAPANARDAALIATLAPGAYTAVIRGVGGATGVALAEVYARD
ncbi:MAG: hypothetical protein JSR82_11045 [Verrucomicrobia bacterium]|nr:hypothetical protein [Verrucomicrobiota bacterium]